MSLSYCGDLVRRHDPDRFLLSLYIPAAVRESLWALYAYNYEVSRTREVVTETQLGLIRLQWWRDAIAGIYDGLPVKGNPLVDALLQVIHLHDLPRDAFDDLAYAREFDLEDRQPANMEGLLRYAEYTSAPLMALAQKVTGSTDGAKDIATAFALVQLLRAVPLHLQQRRCFLPADMTPHLEEIYEGRELERLKPAVRRIVTAAEDHLAPGRGRLARLHAKFARMYLKKIKKADYNLFAPSMAVPPFMREIRLAAGFL